MALLLYASPIVDFQRLKQADDWCIPIPCDSFYNYSYILKQTYAEMR